MKYKRILTLIAFDQLIKQLALHTSLPNLGILSWTLTFNKGVSFGLFANIPPWVLSLLIIAVGLYVLSTLPSPKSNAPTSHSWYFSLIAAGFISNLIDRLFYPGVIDMMIFKIGPLKWPFIFNVADIYICLGVLIVLWQARQTDDIQPQSNT